MISLPVKLSFIVPTNNILNTINSTEPFLERIKCPTKLCMEKMVFDTSNFGEPKITTQFFFDRTNWKFLYDFAYIIFAKT